jgi:hypothetical protein
LETSTDFVYKNLKVDESNTPSSFNVKVVSNVNKNSSSDIASNKNSNSSYIIENSGFKAPKLSVKKHPNQLDSVNKLKALSMGPESLADKVRAKYINNIFI